MNILQILPKLEIGGVERGTVDLARFLTLNAHKAVVVSGGGRLVKKLDEVGARHYKLPVGNKNPFIMIIMVFKLREIIKKENIDIVHARSRIPALTGYFAARLAFKPFITTAHGQYRKHLMSYVMGWGKLVIVASSVMSRYMIENFNVRPDKIRIIPRAVDLKRFAFKSPSSKNNKAFTVGMISRITPLKGHEDFLKAVSILSRSIVKLKAYIVGNKGTAKTDYIRQLELLIKRLGLSGVVEFMDQTDDVPSLLNRLDVLVSANREQEAFGRVIIEGQSAGVPCVATKVGGIVDIIKDTDNGLLCKPADPQNMADKIFMLYKDKGLQQLIAYNGRKTAEKNFSMEKMMASTMKVYNEAKQQQRILIIKISAIGDVILSLPSIKAVREKYNNAVIKVLVGMEAKDVLKNNPYIDELIVCDLKKRDKGINGVMRISKLLKKEDFDIVIDLQNNKKSHILSFLSFAPKRCGYDNGKLSFLLNRKVKDSGLPMDPVKHQLNVLRLVGIQRMTKEFNIISSDEDSAWVDRFFHDNWIKKGSHIVCLHLETSPKWRSKRWPVQNFVKLAGRLAKELSVRVVVTGVDPHDEWVQEFLKSSRSKPVSAVGKTNLSQLIALIEKSGVLVCADSAPIHIASAVKTPFVGLFGPTDPARHVPAEGEHITFYKKKGCVPCYKPECKRGYICMRSINCDEVFKAVQDLLYASERVQKD